MKKFYLGLVSLMLIMLHSCSQDELESTPINEPQAIKVVNIIDGNISTANTRTDDANYATMALQFSSEAEVQELLDDLKEMSIDERLKFTDSLGFISLEKLLRVADEELDSLGASATSEADFRVKHAAYKEKYSNFFIFNNQQEDDLSPYIPTSEEGDIYAFLVGENHKIVIGNVIYDINFSDTMREEDALLYCNNLKNDNEVSTRAENIPVNSFKIISGSKKTTFSGAVKYENLRAEGTPKLYKLYYHFGAQKKMWYGWKRDSARGFAITSKNNTNRFIGNAGGNINVYANYYLGRPTDVFSELAYVWTDMTLKDANGTATYDKNKAYKCQINMSYNNQ